MRFRTMVMAAVITGMAVMSSCSTESPQQAEQQLAQTAVGNGVNGTQLTVTSNMVTAMCSYNLVSSLANSPSFSPDLLYIDSMNPCSPTIKYNENAASAKNASSNVYAGSSVPVTQWQQANTVTFAAATATLSDGSQMTIYIDDADGGSSDAVGQWCEPPACDFVPPGS